MLGRGQRETAERQGRFEGQEPMRCFVHGWVMDPSTDLSWLVVSIFQMGASPAVVFVEHRPGSQMAADDWDWH